MNWGFAGKGWRAGKGWGWGGGRRGGFGLIGNELEGLAWDVVGLDIRREDVAGLGKMGNMAGIFKGLLLCVDGRNLGWF